MRIVESECCLEVEHRPEYGVYLSLVGILLLAVYSIVFWKSILFGILIVLLGFPAFVILTRQHMGYKMRLNALEKSGEIHYHRLVWFRRPLRFVQFSFSEVDYLEIRHFPPMIKWSSDHYEIRARVGRSTLPLTNQGLSFKESLELANKVSRFMGLMSPIKGVEEAQPFWKSP